MGLVAKDLRFAVRFMKAVDLIAENLGPGAKELILGGHYHVTPERVVQISRTPPERQRFAMNQLARGRPPRAEFLEGTAPPLDTLG